MRKSRWPDGAFLLLELPPLSVVKSNLRVLLNSEDSCLIVAMYEPRPIDVSGIKIPLELEALIERLAENVHDVWACQRLADGWSYGLHRDDQAKTHPCLVPYDLLPDSEKRYDRETALGTLAAIMALGYRIDRQ